MKKLALVTVMMGMLSAMVAVSAHAVDFSDITTWVGSGSNQAGLIVDWNGDGLLPQYQVWGYKWDGAASGEDMLKAVAAADSRFYAVIETDPTYGDYVFGLGYDVMNDGSGFVSTTPGDETGHANNPGNHYCEGWYNNGYWSYWGKDTTDSDWNWPGAGMGSRTLANGCWDAWTFGYASNEWTAPEPLSDFIPAAVPEPTSLIALAGGLVSLAGLALRKRK